MEENVVDSTTWIEQGVASLGQVEPHNLTQEQVDQLNEISIKCQDIIHESRIAPSFRLA